MEDHYELSFWVRFRGSTGASWLKRCGVYSHTFEEAVTTGRLLLESEGLEVGRVQTWIKSSAPR